MSKTALFAAVAAGALVAAGAANAQELRIGYLNTTTGGGAVIGKHIENGFRLGLERVGWTKDGDKLGGVPTRIFWADDQQKTDVGKKEVEKFLKQDRTHIVAGIIWSNVMLTVADDVFNAKALLVSSNAGPAEIAGPKCSKYWVSTSFQNEQNAQATGVLVTREGVKTVYAMAPNYAAGKENVDGFKKTYKGKIVSESFFKVGETDYQAEFSKIRAEKPEAVYVFAPGAMGIAFMKQWTAAGMGKDFKLYTLYSVDWSTLPAIGDAAVGSIQTSHWTPDHKDPRNEAFLKAYTAKFNSMPSFFAVQSYDTATAIDMGVKAVGGKLDDMAAVAAAIRKGTLSSPRGDLKYNHNGFLIQPYYKREIIKGADGKPTIVGRGVVFNEPDDHGPKCPAANRI
jgi:branched-chain amino acid transport system substrate-binding protein